jgi:hypothetical protein
VEFSLAILTTLAASGAVAGLLSEKLLPHLPAPITNLLLKLKLVEEANPEPFEERVGAAINALTYASSTVGDLQREIEDRLDEIQALQKRHELLQLDQKTIEAVALELTGAVKQEGRRSLALNTVTSAFFFLAGVGITLLAA